MRYAGGQLPVAAILLLALGCSSGDSPSRTASSGSEPAAPSVVVPPPPPAAGVAPLAPLPSGTTGTSLTPPPPLAGTPEPSPTTSIGQAATPVIVSPSLTVPPTAPGTPAMPPTANGSPATTVPGTTPSLGPTAPSTPSMPPPTQPVAQPAAQPDGDLIRQAQFALASGRVEQALDYLRAAAIIRPEGEVLNKFRWSPGLKRPLLLTRWGLAFCQVGGKSADDQKKTRAQGGTPIAGGTPVSGGTPIPGSTTKTEADAGMWRPLVGPPLVRKLSDRTDAEAFETWLAELAKNLPLPTQAAPALGTAIPPSGTASGTMVPASATAVPPTAAPPTAVSGPTAIAGPGMGISPMGIPAGTLSGKVGLDILDATDSKLARQKALSEGIDVLVIAEASVRAARGRTPGQTHLVLRLIDVEANSELWSSPPLSDTKVRTAQEKAMGDPVEELIAGLLSVVDQQLRLIEIPPISPEAARRRAETLTARPTDKPLPALMELRYYAGKSLLTPQELSTQYSKLIGPDDGPHLALDAGSERLVILRRWLPK